MIKNKRYFAKGKRGIIYIANYKNKKVAIKTKNPCSKAVERIKNEAKYLKLLNKHKIGPKIIEFKDNKLIYEFVEGDFILDYIKNNNKKSIIKILTDIFNQLYILDQLKINKEEMHHPLKHIIIKKKPVLIDFERCYKAKKTHNVTQFCQFLLSCNKELSKKGIEIKKSSIIRLSKKYKKDPTKNNLNLILKYITK